MLSELVIYTFDVKLLFVNGKEEYVPFRIIGRRGKRAAAEAELKKWLETDGHKHSGYKYIEWVGIRDKSCDFVLINPDQENVEELINESKEYIKEIEPDQPVTTYEKCQKKKENIEVDLFIDARKEALGNSICSYCYDNKKPCRREKIGCSDCKDDFFDNMYNDLIEEFLIK